MIGSANLDQDRAALHHLVDVARHHWVDYIKVHFQPGDGKEVPQTSPDEVALRIIRDFPVDAPHRLLPLAVAELLALGYGPTVAEMTEELRLLRGLLLGGDRDT